MYGAENQTALRNDCGKKQILASGCSRPSSELLLGCIHKTAEAPLKAKLRIASRSLNEKQRPSVISCPGSRKVCANISSRIFSLLFSITSLDCRGRWIKKLLGKDDSWRQAAMFRYFFSTERIFPSTVCHKNSHKHQVKIRKQDDLVCTQELSRKRECSAAARGMESFLNPLGWS